MTCDHSLQTQSYLDGELHGAAARGGGAPSAELCRLPGAGAEDRRSQRSDAHGHGSQASAALRGRVAAALDRQHRPVRPFWLGAASGAGISDWRRALAFLAIMPPSAASLAQSVTDAMPALCPRPDHYGDFQ